MTKSMIAVAARHSHDDFSPGRHLQDGHRSARRSSTHGLRVHGIEGLRVADASIMPIISQAATPTRRPS